MIIHVICSLFFYHFIILDRYNEVGSREILDLLFFLFLMCGTTLLSCFQEVCGMNLLMKIAFLNLFQ